MRTATAVYVPLVWVCCERSTLTCIRPHAANIPPSMHCSYACILLVMPHRHKDTCARAFLQGDLMCKAAPMECFLVAYHNQCAASPTPFPRNCAGSRRHEACRTQYPQASRTPKVNAPLPVEVGGSNGLVGHACAVDSGASHSCSITATPWNSCVHMIMDASRGRTHYRRGTAS